MSENLSDMEKKAIEEAHEDFYQALVKIGCDNAFFNCTPEQIDSVIEAVWNGVRKSMHMQSAKGQIPW